MGGYLSNPLGFAIDTLGSLYVVALLLRFLLQWLRADAYNPLSQFLIRITHPPLKILRRFVPSIGRIDTSSLLLAFLLLIGLQWTMLNLFFPSIASWMFFLYRFMALFLVIFRENVFNIYKTKIR